MTNNVKPQPQALEHWHKNDAQVRLTLERVGKIIGISRTEAIKRFRAGDLEVTESFWSIVWSDPNNRKLFNRINFCTTCQKFEIFREDE